MYAGGILMKTEFAIQKRIDALEFDLMSCDNETVKSYFRDKISTLKWVLE